MCHAADSEPPLLPPDLVARPRIAGGAAAEVLELESADGTRFSAAIAEAPDARGPGIVVLPDVRGLHPFYMRLAERFADAGHPAVAMDYFGRTAGLGPRDEDFEYMPHVAQTRAEHPAGRRRGPCAPARAHRAASAVSVGFCFGGAQSFLLATAPEVGFDAVSASTARWRASARARRRRCIASRTRAARCSGCSATPTRRSPSSRCGSSRPALSRPASSTRS